MATDDCERDTHDEFTILWKDGMYRVSTPELYASLRVVPKSRLETAEQRADIAEGFHRVAVAERDAERRKAQTAERRERALRDALMKLEGALGDLDDSDTEASREDLSAAREEACALIAASPQSDHEPEKRP